MKFREKDYVLPMFEMFNRQLAFCDIWGNVEYQA